jgi:small Trp-rich protein
VIYVEHYLAETSNRQAWLTAAIDRYILSPYSAEKGVAMPIIIAIVALSILRYFEIGPFATLSWWWVAGLFLVAFIWFEFIERMLGLDKRKANKLQEKAREKRIKKAFEK